MNCDFLNSFELRFFAIEILNNNSLKGGQNLVLKPLVQVRHQMKGLAIPKPKFQKKLETSNFCSEPPVKNIKNTKKILNKYLHFPKQKCIEIIFNAKFCYNENLVRYNCHLLSNSGMNVCQ